MYITEANLKRLFATISCDEIRLQQLLQLYPDLHKLLSTPELKQLTAIENFMVGDLNLEIIKIDEIKQYNNSNYVYQHSKPYYHSNQHCPRLEQDYINVLIPKKVQELGEEEVEKYRQFFPNQNPNDNSNEKIKKIQIGITAVKAHYLSKGIELHDGEMYEIIERNHTQPIYVNTILDLDVKIQEYKKFLNHLSCHENTQIKNIFDAKYCDIRILNSLYRNKNNEIKNIVNHMKTFREEIFSLAINKLIIIHEFNKNNLNQAILDKLGFGFCSHCSAQLLRSIFN